MLRWGGHLPHECLSEPSQTCPSAFITTIHRNHGCLPFYSIFYCLLSSSSQGFLPRKKFQNEFIRIAESKHLGSKEQTCCSHQVYFPVLLTTRQILTFLKPSRSFFTLQVFNSLKIGNLFSPQDVLLCVLEVFP